LWHHAKTCWGDEAVDVADATKNWSVTEAALKILNTKKNGSIMAAFVVDEVHTI